MHRNVELYYEAYTLDSIEVGEAHERGGYQPGGYYFDIPHDMTGDALREYLSQYAPPVSFDSDDNDDDEQPPRYGLVLTIARWLSDSLGMVFDGDRLHVCESVRWGEAPDLQQTADGVLVEHLCRAAHPVTIASNDDPDDGAWHPFEVAALQDAMQRSIRERGWRRFAPDLDHSERLFCLDLWDMLPRSVRGAVHLPTEGPRYLVARDLLLHRYPQHRQSIAAALPLPAPPPPSPPEGPTHPRCVAELHAVTTPDHWRGCARSDTVAVLCCPVDGATTRGDLVRDLLDDYTGTVWDGTPVGLLGDVDIRAALGRMLSPATADGPLFPDLPQPNDPDDDDPIGTHCYCYVRIEVTD